MTYVIAEPCVDLLDKACIEECPVDCIYEGGRMLYIHPDECVDCGACEPVCPVEAIFYEDDLPEKWRDYTRPMSTSSTTSARRAAPRRRVRPTTTRSGSRTCRPSSTPSRQRARRYVAGRSIVATTAVTGAGAVVHPSLRVHRRPS